MIQVVQPKITAEEFCYRLQGFLEIENPDSISSDIFDKIKGLLRLVQLPTIPPKITAYYDDRVVEVKDANGIWNMNIDQYNQTMVKSKDKQVRIR
jgi:hypothetical protein